MISFLESYQISPNILVRPLNLSSEKKILKHWSLLTWVNESVVWGSKATWSYWHILSSRSKSKDILKHRSLLESVGWGSKASQKDFPLKLLTWVTSHVTFIPRFRLFTLSSSSSSRHILDFNLDFCGILKILFNCFNTLV